MGFENQSYNSHMNSWRDDLLSENRRKVHELWFRTDTADYWRHARMYEAARSFLHHPAWQWVTIGDGRFGLDSVRLRRMGIESVLATDIGGALLEDAKQRGIIDDYRVENAERLSFADGSVDVVFCKESYHHFPRPPVALYEMLRIARKAVILVEPRDYVIDRPATRPIGPVGLIKGLGKWLSGRLGVAGRPIPIARRYSLGDLPHYEDSGNYQYTVSSREMEKVALGLNLPTLALKGLNDCYDPEGGTAAASDESPVFRAMKETIDKADRNAERGNGSTGLLMVILFLEPPDEKVRECLHRDDWLVSDLPRNPYLT